MAVFVVGTGGVPISSYVATASDGDELASRKQEAISIASPK